VETDKQIILWYHFTRQFYCFHQLRPHHRLNHQTIQRKRTNDSQNNRGVTHCLHFPHIRQSFNQSYLHLSYRGHELISQQNRRHAQAIQNNPGQSRVHLDHRQKSGNRQRHHRAADRARQWRIGAKSSKIERGLDAGEVEIDNNWFRRALVEDEGVGGHFGEDAEGIPDWTQQGDDWRNDERAPKTELNGFVIRQLYYLWLI